MCYVVLQASFRAMENDIVVLLDLLINQEEILGENVKKRKKKSGTQVGNSLSDCPQPLKTLQIIFSGLTLFTGHLKSFILI